MSSLTHQTDQDFEVIVVEDGSSIQCEEVVQRYASVLKVKYFFKQNSGPGQSRNYGSERATGNYLVFLDSDCVIPPHYIDTIRKELTGNPVDAFGGPDSAHPDFTNLQKAINYSMTSFLTTGGIRGGGEKMDRFFPRSFNMGYSRKVFETTGGFERMRFGEDIDMSIRILEAGYKTRLFRDAYVYHKRRSNFRQFFKQVHNSGIARINLNKRHPGTLKPVHALPAIFVIGTLTALVLALCLSIWFLLPHLLLTLMLFIDASLKSRSFRIGLLATAASYVQLMGYGSGFMRAFWKRHLLGQDEFSAFERNFYN